MSEGGFYPWKVQKIHRPRDGLVATCDYKSDLSAPLPDPPKGQTWVRDESTREWSLVPVVSASAVPPGEEGGDAAVAFAVAVADASGKTVAVAGVRYHEVTPTDTFQGLCLRYKVTPTELRRANRMMGNNLKLAPERLVIPSNEKNRKLDEREPTKEEKIAALLSKLPLGVRAKLSYSEARAYLEIADWDVSSAVNDVNEDFCS
eukprot:CAMPEP_0172530174 /NCGR_PEP_ID=MMETSP1067-20121228/3993_1 /TAXON_ID=265564 ORGANISM="Thalassiosira punctigera, Strain Tpunct2005C2" /NCGR_SAMPLE_ID=MMETSP1067 /ASSEMBLY_ACC=CAM_ASM_000444 /LENGTH=203 /DNA_ID=CAMNT_0013314329 /DNA_START=90 /DNA_END=701 /DNA_ORIENTATION=-